MLVLTLLSACILWDTSPAEQRIADLTDADGDGVSPTAGDCNDYDPALHPGAVELCDGIDNDCDRERDEDGGDVSWCLDEDGDGHGDAATTSTACATPTTAVTTCDDCDDRSARVYPGADDLCDGLDNDCDGETDPPDAPGAPEWYPDEDQDGWGTAAGARTNCEAPAGYTNQVGDCNDADAAVHPDAPEVCNDGVDGNCDGTPDSCGLYGSLELEAGILSPDEGGFILGEYQDAALGLGRAVLDVFGDGTADILLTDDGEGTGSGSTGRINLWASPPRGEASDPPALQLLGQDGLCLGYSSAAPRLIDLDGSGRPFLVVGAYGTAPGFARGGSVLAIDPATLTSRTVSPDDVWMDSDIEDEWFGYSVMDAGSLVAGPPSLVVGAISNSALAHWAGVVYLLPRSASGPEQATAVIRAEVASGDLGARPPPPVDLNGDGIDDLVLPMGYYPEDAGILTYLGPLSGEYRTDDAHARLTQPGDDDPGDHTIVLSGASGAPLIVSTSGGRDGSDDGAAYVIPGDIVGVSTFAEQATAILVGDPDTVDGRIELGEGDINGDAESDLLVGIHASDFADKAWLTYGPITFEGVDTLDNQAHFQMIGGDDSVLFATGFATGDVNNDAHDDMVIISSRMLDPETQWEGAWLLYGEGI